MDQVTVRAVDFEHVESGREGAPGGGGEGLDQDHILAATFHPDLSTDRRVHRLFCAMAAQHGRDISKHRDATTSARP